MTLVLGLEHRGHVYLCGDSSVTSRAVSDVIREPKVFVRDGWAIGFSGSGRVGSLLTYRLRLPRLARSTPLDQFVHVEIIDALRTLLRENGLEDPDDESEDVTWELVIGRAGKLWTIQDYDPCRSTFGATAIGIGGELGLGALDSLREARPGLRPETMLRRAARACARRCTNVRAPFVVVKA